MCGRCVKGMAISPALAAWFVCVRAFVEPCCICGRNLLMAVSEVTACSCPLSEKLSEQSFGIILWSVRASTDTF